MLFVIMKLEFARYGGRLALCGGSGPSDYIDPPQGIHGKEGKLMSDFEMLSLVIMILALVIAALKESDK